MRAPTPAQLRAIGTQVPVYAQRWAQAGVAPGEVNSLSQLPVIDKHTLLAAGVEARLDRRFHDRRLTWESTSGSSGEPMKLAVDAATRRRRRWRFMRALLAAGYRPGDRLLLISTHHRSPVLSMMRWTYVDLKLGETELLDRYEQCRPQVLYGPLRALMSIGERLQAARCAHRPRLLISTAEQLRPQDQQQLRQCFGIEAADFYGMTEIGLYAWRPPADPHYRVVANDIHSEFLADGAGSSAERLLVTTLRPCAMPLVRFDTGDLVRRDPSAPGAPITEFVGREIDGVLLRDGQRLSPYRLTLAIEAVPGVARYQIVQHADLSIDVAVKPGGGHAPGVIDAARAAVAAVLGTDMIVRAATMPADATRLAEKFRPVRSNAKAVP